MTDYARARAEHDRAARHFQAIRGAYVNPRLADWERPTDAEFLEAKRIYDEATARFDKAFAEAQKA